MHDYDNTIDWHQFWNDANDEDRTDTSPSTIHALDALFEFFAEMDVPDSFADVGCGPGHVARDVAERYPEASVVGYDAAEPVLAENRKRVRDSGPNNLRFEQTVLPAFDPDQQFDAVFSYFTLCYVADIERAIENLYDAVAPGGHLVFNYHNRLAQAHYCMIADDPEEWLNESSAFDPERYAERFQLVIDGKSLLSYERIHDTLGTWPQSFWSVVERPDKRWAWRHVPLVYVPK